MALSISLATQIVALFILVLVGYVLVKTNILKVEDATTLSKLVLYVCAPATIIKAFQIDLTPSRMQGFLLAGAAAIVIHIVFFIIVGLLGRIFHFNTMEKASVIYSNAGNLIIPLVTLVLGEKMVFYASAYMIVQTILFWTHCKAMMSNETHIDLKKILFNINMIAIYIGVLLCVFRVPLPPVISSALSTAAAPIGMLSMMVIGMILSGMNLKRAFRNSRVYLVTFFRLIVLPAVVLIIFVVSGLYKIFDGADKVLMISLLAASGPSASTVSQFAAIYNNEPEEASLINAMTVIFCIVTMPLLNMIYTLLINS